MGSVRSYQTAAGKRWRAQWRTPSHDQRQQRGFLTKKAAELHLAEVEVSKARGEYVDTSDSRATIATLGAAWLDGRGHVMKPSAFRPLDSAWRIHVEPRWGTRTVGSVRHSEVQAWVSELARTKSATTVLRAHGVLAGILDAAVRDRRLSRNVARDVALPRKTGKARVYLTHAQVALLASEAAHPSLVLTLAYTGLRWGEATGLRIRHVDALRRRLSIEENAVMVSGAIVVGTPKTHETRSVPYPRFLEVSIAQLCEDKRRQDLLFGDGAAHMRLPNSVSGWFAAAVNRAQDIDQSFPRVTPHDLRHTAASLAISAGANVKAVQRMLGHASAAMTLDTYADLFDDDLDGVADALDQARTTSVVAVSLPRAESGN